jgi:serine/threonine-protein kinase
MVGPYRLVRLIAQGGMAEVYRAEQVLAGGTTRPVALKVIRPDLSESDEFREMFLDEARNASMLSHPNIVHIHEVGDADGMLYMAMELVPGESLAVVERVLRERGLRLTDEALLAVGIATCAALEAVHARPKLVHRDVSPHNLLLTAKGALKLIDFGIAKAATNRSRTRVGTTKGKAGYFSPEQAMGRSLDGRSDLFSVGVTLYKLAAGVGPLEGHDTVQVRHTALVQGEWEPLARVCPELPRGLAAVVDKALQVKPDNRFASARAMREALEAVAVEAGLPRGATALAGYVQEQDGEFSVAENSPARPRGKTGSHRALPRASGSKRRVLGPLLGVGVGLGVALGGLAVLQGRSGEEGEGTLRIDLAPRLSEPVEVQLPGGERQRLPVDLPKWKAGRYALEFFTSGGTVRCEAQVRPSQSTQVVFLGSGCEVAYLN